MRLRSNEKLVKLVGFMRHPSCKSSNVSLKPRRMFVIKFQLAQNPPPNYVYFF